MPNKKEQKGAPLEKQKDNTWKQSAHKETICVSANQDFIGTSKKNGENDQGWLTILIDPNMSQSHDRRHKEMQMIRCYA